MWALLCVGVSATAQEPELVVEVDRDQVYVGESIIYQLTLNHVENPSAPDLSSFKNFAVEFLGEQSMNSQQITIINGRRSEVIRRGMMYQYRLTPTDSSTTEIPAPTAVVNGQTLTGRSIPISVIAPSDQNIAILQMSCDQTSVFLMRPFTVTLKVLVKRLPDEISGRSPLSVQDRTPVRLVIPWLDDQNLPTGLDPQVEWREILQPMMQTSRRGFREDPDGFQINNIGTTSISFFGRETTVFKPTPKPVDQTDDQGNVVQYFEYTFERTFTASKPGTYSLGPVNVKGTFGTEIKNGRLAGEEVYAVSAPLTIEAKSAPLANRPSSYIGVIGQNFAAEASLAPSEGRVGDPMTLTVEISGTGHLDDAVPPNLSETEGVDSAFRTYDATINSQQNAKVFTYSLRPLTTEVTEFPSLSVSYFDPLKEDYITIKTAAIPVSIQEARELSNADIVSSGATTKSADPLLQSTSGGIFANHSSLESLKASSFSLKRWGGIWAAMLCTFAAVSVGMKHQQRLHADPAFVRRKAARLNAANTLKSLHPGSGDKVVLDTINDAVKGLIADFTGNASAGMTSNDAVNHLAVAGITDELQQRTRQFMDQCDAARYGASPNSLSELIGICSTLVTDLGAALEKQC